MLSFFFYGTLMDPDLRAAVLGGPCLAVTSAALPGYRRAPVAGRDYPGIAPARNRGVPGLLATGVTPAMAARATYYEGDRYAAALVSVTAADGAARDAWTFLPLPGTRVGTGGWDLAAWQRRRKAPTLALARTYMAAGPVSGIRRLEAAWMVRLRRSIRA
ncbi:MAG: gamma-glutamylcyclotransferase [Rhodospirillales bacterium CG15_BIG_FIL_POST_REV_8_21_14_020_66_15]|nr:MAG: gamma-glutamylcyclotransferase [Rhodospirillales bacterium CG15_BIG_FIL_POST_REV_8_21_14_020_66_15]